MPTHIFIPLAAFLAMAALACASTTQKPANTAPVAPRDPARQAADWVTRGLQQKQAGQLEDARRSFVQAQTLDPNLHAAYAAEGATLVRLERFAEAIAPLKTAIRLAPRDLASHINLGLALRRLGRAEEAVMVYEAALELNASHPDLLNNLAVALRQLGRGAEAIPYLRRAIEQRPDDALMRFNLAIALRSLAQFDAALEQLEQAHRLDAKHTETLHEMGVCHEQLGNKRQAADAYSAYADRIEAKDAATALKVRRHADALRAAP